MRQECFFLLIAVVLCGNMNFAQERIKIAVVPFKNNTGNKYYDGITVGIGESVTTILAGSGKFDFIERIQIDKALQEQDFQMSDNVDPKTVQEIGKVLGVQYMIIGDLQKIKDKFRINARRMRVEDGKLEEAVSVVGIEEELFDMQDAIGKKLEEKFGK
jgi:adenylate cyclase